MKPQDTAIYHITSDSWKTFFLLVFASNAINFVLLPVARSWGMYEDDPMMQLIEDEAGELEKAAMKARATL